MNNSVTVNLCSSLSLSSGLQHSRIRISGQFSNITHTDAHQWRWALWRSNLTLSPSHFPVDLTCARERCLLLFIVTSSFLNDDYIANMIVSTIFMFRYPIYLYKNNLFKFIYSNFFDIQINYISTQSRYGSSTPNQYSQDSIVRFISNPLNFN
jgi:hypothetical protein